MSPRSRGARHDRTQKLIKALQPAAATRCPAYEHSDRVAHSLLTTVPLLPPPRSRTAQTPATLPDSASVMSRPNPAPAAAAAAAGSPDPAAAASAEKDPDLKIILLGDSAVGTTTAETGAGCMSGESNSRAGNTSLTGRSPALRLLCVGVLSGKSKLVERFLMNDYVPRQMSTYALTVFRHRAHTEDGRTIEIDFWDTAGQERFNR